MLDKLEDLYFGFVVLVILSSFGYMIHDWIAAWIS